MSTQMTREQLQSMSVQDLVNFVSGTPKKIVNRKEQGTIRLIDKRTQKVDSDYYIEEEGFFVRQLTPNCHYDRVGKSIHETIG
jgi:hypothetical protein